MKAAAMMLIILCTMTMSGVIGSDSEEESGEAGVAGGCGGVSPASRAALGGPFRDMPVVFEHVLHLLQRDPAVLERSERAAPAAPGRPRRLAPTPRNLERLLNSIETQLVENSKHRGTTRRKRESTSGRTRGAEKTEREHTRGTGRPKRDVTKLGKTSDSQDVRTADSSKLNNNYEMQQNKKRTTSSEADKNGNETKNKPAYSQHSGIVKRSDDDVGDSDRDIVKEQADGGAPPPPSGDNSGEARADDGGGGGGGGGQQMVVGTFRAIMMPMSGAAQAISGLVPSD